MTERSPSCWPVSTTLPRGRIPEVSLPPKRRRNEAHFDLRAALIRMTGVDLTQIEGIESLTASKIIGEIGTDMTKWPSAKHFASWLGLCPGNKITGGRRLSGRTTPCANRAATALRLSAQTLWRSKSAMGAYLRRRAAFGGMPAITATAHKLARTLYFMLKHGTDYVGRTQEEYETVSTTPKSLPLPPGSSCQPHPHRSL